MIRIAVQRGLGDKEVQPVSDDRITNEQMAIRIGANFLNNVYYIKDKRTIQVPHRTGIQTGLFVTVEENKIPISGKHHVKSVTISGGSRTGIWNNIEIQRFEEP